MRFTSGLLIAATLAALLTSGAGAQSPVTLGAGTRVRVLMSEASRSVVANIVGLKRDTIVLGRSYGTVQATMPLPVAQIRKLEVWNGRRASLAPVGALAGILLGAVVVSGYNGIVSSQCFPPRPCSDGAPVWLGAGVGGLVGGLSLALVRPDRWIEVALPGQALAPGGETR